MDGPQGVTRYGSNPLIWLRPSSDNSLSDGSGCPNILLISKAEIVR